MPDQTKAYGSVKRYGVRYGTKLKGKIGKIEAERRASTQCPYCHYEKAKRIAAGIWHCTKCKSRFTGKAYTVGGKVAIAAPSEAAKEAPAGPEGSEAVEEEESPEEDAGSSEDEEQDNEREA